MPSPGLFTEPACELAGDDPGRFAAALGKRPPDAHVVSVAPRPVAPILRRGADGQWAAGSYCGVLCLDGSLLRFEPRMGWPALTGWVDAATGLSGGAFADAANSLDAATALIWVRAVDGASRHGPPAFRRDVEHTGAGLRGRLEVRRTVRLRARGSSEAASVYRARDLDNPVTRTIVAADRVLTRRVGHGHWRTNRVEDILPQLHAAVGRRAAPPRDGALARMRYTPITRPFRRAAELSARIVRQDPVATTPLPGRPQGLLLDLESVWSAALVAWTRQARPDLRCESDAGQVALRDRTTVRASLVVRGSGLSGGPIVRASAFATEPVEFELPLDARAAAAAVSAVLATA